RLAPEHPDAVELTALADHPQEPQVVRPRAVEATAPHVELRLLGDLEGDRLERAVRAAHVHPGEAAALLGSYDEGGVAHAEGPADVLVQVVLEGPAAHPLDELAGPVDADAVLPALAGVGHQRGGQRHVPALDDTGDAVVRHVAADVAVPDVVREAG